MAIQSNLRIKFFHNAGMTKQRLLIYAIIIVLALPFSSLAENHSNAFTTWLDQLRLEAISGGISSQTWELAFAGIHTPNPKIISFDRNQPEAIQTLDAYLSAQINARRIRIGQQMIQRYPTWLDRVEKKYNVQKRFLVALWGIETGYGENQGAFPVIHSLATLAFDGRRADYFRKELIDALRLLDDGIISHKRMTGSWAGAMGNFQFMPSSYRRYALDEDQSGSINLWRSVPDSLGSAAHYLATAGWKNDQTWGREVRLPVDFDLSLAGLETRLPLSRWQSLGVRRSNGQPLPTRDIKASLIMPDGPGGRTFLVYDNFRVIMSWNQSQLFALAVGVLSDHFN